MTTPGSSNTVYREEKEVPGQVTQAALQLDTDNVSMGISLTRSYDHATGLVNCIDATVTSPRRPAFNPLAFASYY